MTIGKVAELLDADVLTESADLGREIETICGSDMMSDVLAFIKRNALLLTGLTNPQVIRTAEMLDIICIAFIRGKKPTAEMIEMAQDCGIVILQSTSPMYEACGKLYHERGY
ncbi:MAG: hypothetical protein LUG27_06865 [Clostridiales bacterium]|nr:hypothetical protein [Clostridiales bacterium]MCD8134297.1 hypothetical protein [Clostridiales bacterium]